MVVDRDARPMSLGAVATAPSGLRRDSSQIDLSDEEVDRLFHALADATRRDIVRRTLTAEASVSQLAAAYDMSFAAVQKHVAVLERAGLVTKLPSGRQRIVRGNPSRISKAQRLLGRYEELWRSRISRLDAVLTNDTGRPVRD